MRVALSIPVKYDDATFEFLMPDAAMARLLPVLVGKLAQLPGDAQEALTGNCDKLAAAEALGYAMLDTQLLTVAAEAFCAGVVAWEGVVAPDGSPLACSPKNHGYIPLVDKLAIVFLYVGQQQALAQKKGPAMSPLMSATPPEPPVAT